MSILGGVDIGGTKCAVCVGESVGDQVSILGKRRFATLSSPQETLAEILAQLKGLLDECGVRPNLKAIGITCGVYITEFKTSRLSPAVRFAADILNGVPSIVIGIFAWQFLVRPVKHFSALAGGIALAVMMIPLVSHATEEIRRAIANVRDVIQRSAPDAGQSREHDAVVRRQPLGVVAVISAWNNPVAIPLGKIAPALTYTPWPPVG